MGPCVPDTRRHFYPKCTPLFGSEASGKAKTISFRRLAAKVGWGDGTWSASCSASRLDRGGRPGELYGWNIDPGILLPPGRDIYTPEYLLVNRRSWSWRSCGVWSSGVGLLANEVNERSTLGLVWDVLDLVGAQRHPPIPTPIPQYTYTIRTKYLTGHEARGYLTIWMYFWCARDPSVWEYPSLS